MNWANPVYPIIAVRTVQASLLGLLAHWLWHWPLTGPHALGLCLTPLLCAYFVFVFVATLTWGLPILTRLPHSAGKAVCLTFDDGPSLETTPQILAILREHNARATFFVLGEAVERCPELLCQIAADGHAVGIHGYHHHPFVLLSFGQIQREIALTREAVQCACPRVSLSCWLRPPHGFKSPGMFWILSRLGYSLAAWSLDSQDYRERDPKRLTAALLAHLHPGAIILLHDGPSNAVTVAALPGLLHGLRERGWQTALLPSDLLA